MVAGVRHTGIVVHDMDGAINFWVEILGFAVVSNQIEEGEFIEKLLGIERVSVQTVKLKAPDSTMVELLKFKNSKSDNIWEGDPQTAGLTHIALNIIDLKQTLEKLEIRGFIPINPARQSPDGKVLVCYIRVLEGLLLELVQTLD